MKFTIPASYYADAFAFMSDDPTRPYLHGLSLEPTGHVAATDGHILFAAAIPADRRHNLPAAAVIIPRDKKLAAACKAKGREISTRFLVIDRPDTESMRVTLRIVYASEPADACQADADILFTLETSLVDGTFPDWRRFIPKPDATGHACPAFDASLVAKLGTAAAAKQMVRIVPSVDETTPCFVDLGRDDAFAVIMPCRMRPLIKDDAKNEYAATPSVPSWATLQPVTEDLTAQAAD